MEAEEGLSGLKSYTFNMTGFDNTKTYYVYISTGTKNSSTLDTLNSFEDAMIICEKGNYNKVRFDKYIELNGDIYVSVVERQKKADGYTYENKIIVPNRVVERPKQNALGLRTKCYFNHDYTSTFINEPNSGKEERKIKVKIGTISDKEILKSIRDGKSDALANLLKYAKGADSIYQGTLPIGQSSSITSNLGLVDGRYYYVYMELDDENGTYYPVEDVSLYQALVGETVGANLYDYLDDNFKWDLGDDENAGSDNKEEKKEEKKDDTVIPNKKLPQTGVSAIVGGFVVVAIISGVVFAIKSRKYNI